MEILRITTAGSVDDGKSTLIGRLLYETDSLKIDQVETIEEKSKSLGYDYIDFSLATDGLLTEREQGITIDVSHLYFSTPKEDLLSLMHQGMWSIPATWLLEPQMLTLPLFFWMQEKE